MFSQLAFQGIIDSNSEKVAAVNGTRIRRGETQRFNLDTGPVAITCETINGGSVRLRIADSPFARTLPGGRNARLDLFNH